MKKLLLILLCIPMIGFTQSIHSKDDVYIGEREEFISACVIAANEKININGIEVASSSYCACVCDHLIPEIYYQDLEKAVQNNAMIELFTLDDNLRILSDCAANSIKIEDNFNFGYKSFEEYSDAEILIGVKSCVLEAEKDPQTSSILTADQILSYCNCAIERLIRQGHSMGQLNEVEDENSESFNEIALPCLESLIIKDENNRLNINEYVKNDVTGGNYMSEIKLNNFLGGGYKVKINIDGVIKYFLFDTGATDLIINSDMERELIFNGIIKKEDYLGKQEFVLADNSVVIGRIVKINNIIIGDYKVNNVIVSVIDGGSLLCGLGLLEKFRKWDFIRDSETLKLYK